MSSAPFGFFLLCIYTALVLIRPHEWPIFDIQFPILRIILVLTFFTYLITLRPKAWNTQCTLLILLFLSMLLSEARAFRFFSDLGPVIDWINSNIIPFIVYLGFLTTLKRQKTILIISILSCVVFTLHSYVQVTSLLGEGWAETVITRYDGPEPIIQARYIGIFNDPNDMGMFLVMNIPIVLFFMFSTTSSMKKLFWGGDNCLDAARNILDGEPWFFSRIIGGYGCHFLFQIRKSKVYYSRINFTTYDHNRTQLI